MNSYSLPVTVST